MSRITACFERLKNSNKQALIPYIVAGDPVPDFTVEVMHKMVAAGADIIELGMPFTDPEAEGAVIQLAHERALTHNTSLTDCLKMVSQFREQDKDTPVLLMGYVNPILTMGYETFAQTAGAAGLDACLLVNVPPGEEPLLNESLKAHQIDTIYLLTPTTTDERAKFICDQAQGFVYYVSLKGTTGASTLDTNEVEARFKHLRPLCKLPLVVGFGIKNSTSAAQVASFADGVVVGAAVVKMFEQHQSDLNKIATGVTDLISDMRRAMDAK